MTKQIPLSKQKRRNSKNTGLVALVSDEDYETLCPWNWSAISTQRLNGGYAVRIENGRMLLMHRQILDASDGTEVDHINGRGLDNRRANLRFATRQQGLANRSVFKSSKSGYKGVRFDEKTGKWKMVFSAHFDSAEEAARVYDQLARFVFGTFAKTNFDE